MIFIEVVVSVGWFDLIEQQEVVLSELYFVVLEGWYLGNVIWLYGIEYLMKNDWGYVYWKGIEVEYYSFIDFVVEKSVVLVFVQCCLMIEFKGFFVNCWLVFDQKFFDVFVGMLWFLLLLCLYLICLVDGKVCWLILFKFGEYVVVIIKIVVGMLEICYYGLEIDGFGCYMVFYDFECEGFVFGSIFMSIYELLIVVVQVGGFMFVDIEQVFV